MQLCRAPGARNSSVRPAPGDMVWLAPGDLACMGHHQHLVRQQCNVFHNCICQSLDASWCCVDNHGCCERRLAIFGCQLVLMIMAVLGGGKPMQMQLPRVIRAVIMVFVHVPSQLPSFLRSAQMVMILDFRKSCARQATSIGRRCGCKCNQCISPQFSLVPW